MSVPDHGEFNKKPRKAKKKAHPSEPFYPESPLFEWENTPPVTPYEELDALSEENPCKIVDINNEEIEIKNPKAVRITVEYDDGVIREAIGKDATAIMEHWVGCELMAFNHGQIYKGPCLKEVKKSKEK